MATERLLEIPESLARALILFRERHHVGGKPVLACRVLQSVEHFLGVEIPDDLVAVFAATRRGLDEVVELTEEARDSRQLPGDQLVLARGEETRSHWRARISMAAGAVDRGAATEVFLWSESGDRADEVLSVAEFVREHFELQRPETTKERIRVDVAFAVFRPAVALDEKPKPQRRVRHPHFGDGRVIRELDGGKKLEIDFDRERIVVMATFCDEVQSGEAAY